jgi:hypothetical protein
MRWTEHASLIGERRHVYRVLVGRPEPRRPFGRPRRRWNNNIEMDLRKVEFGRDWIDVPEDRRRW